MKDANSFNAELYFLPNEYLKIKIVFSFRCSKSFSINDKAELTEPPANGATDSAFNLSILKYLANTSVISE